MHTYTEREELEQPWLMDDWGRTLIQSRIVREVVANEDDALLKWPTNFQGGFSVVNMEKKNRWDVPRGYAVHPGLSPIHNVRGF